jgi:hypothetical protein
MDLATMAGLTPDRTAPVDGRGAVGIDADDS